MMSEMDHSPEFEHALRLFQQSPHVRLVRHVSASMRIDPDFAVRNQGQIARVIHDTLKAQGIDPACVLIKGSPLPFLSEAARRLEMETRATSELPS